MTIAVYPGTFDPITNGHLDIVQRAEKLFDEVIVAVAENSAKKPLFPLPARVVLATKALQDFKCVRVLSFNTLLVEFMHQHQASIIIRGLRAVSDFELEFQLASMNRRLSPDIETLLLIPSERYTFLSSNMVKELARLGGDVSAFVPAEVKTALAEQFRK